MQNFMPFILFYPQNNPLRQYSNCPLFKHEESSLSEYISQVSPEKENHRDKNKETYYMEMAPMIMETQQVTRAARLVSKLETQGSQSYNSHPKASQHKAQEKSIILVQRPSGKKNSLLVGVGSAFLFYPGLHQGGQSALLYQFKS